MKIESIDAVKVRALFERMNLKPMEGSNNSRGEFWVDQSGHPYFLPYYREGDHDRFAKNAFEDLIEKLSS